MSELLDLQQSFVLLVSRLIQFAYSKGYFITFGEAYRTPEQAQYDAAHGKGISHSLHIDRLAIDLNLFKGSAALTEAADYKPLGDYWKALSRPGIQCCWGGDFMDSQGRPKPDADHFSIAFGGRK